MSDKKTVLKKRKVGEGWRGQGGGRRTWFHPVRRIKTFQFVWEIWVVVTDGDVIQEGGKLSRRFRRGQILEAKRSNLSWGLSWAQIVSFSFITSSPPPVSLTPLPFLSLQPSPSRTLIFLICTWEWRVFLRGLTCLCWSPPPLTLRSTNERRCSSLLRAGVGF